MKGVIHSSAERAWNSLVQTSLNMYSFRLPFIEHPRVDECLEGVRQVVEIGEIEAFALEHLLQSLHIDLVPLVFPLARTDELHLGELIDFAAEDLPD